MTLTTNDRAAIAGLAATLTLCASCEPTQPQRREGAQAIPAEATTARREVAPAAARKPTPPTPKQPAQATTEDEPFWMWRHPDPDHGWSQPGLHWQKVDGQDITLSTSRDEQGALALVAMNRAPYQVDGDVDEGGEDTIWSDALPALEGSPRDDRVSTLSPPFGVVPGRYVLAHFAPGAFDFALLSGDMKTGARRWREIVTTPPPEGPRTGTHATAVQVRRAPDDTVRVFARTDAGRWVWELDPLTGELGPRQQVTTPLAALTWQDDRARWDAEDVRPWDAPTTYQANPDRAYTLRPHKHGDPPELSRRDGDTERWRVEIDRAIGESAEMIERDGVLYVALYHRIAAGCQVLAFDAETGAERWRADLFGVGPIAHSKYRNEVDLELRDDALIVWGREAGGRYIEVLAREDGRQRVNILWR